MSATNPSAWLTARGTSEGDAITTSRRTPKRRRSPRCELLPPPARRRPICLPVVRKKLGDEPVGVVGAEAGEDEAAALAVEVGDEGADGGEVLTGSSRGLIEMLAVSFGGDASLRSGAGGGRPLRALSSVSTARRRSLVR